MELEMRVEFHKFNENTFKFLDNARNIELEKVRNERKWEKGEVGGGGQQTWILIGKREQQSIVLIRKLVTTIKICFLCTLRE